jgi:GH18 family chitinase
MIRNAPFLLLVAVLLHPGCSAGTGQDASFDVGAGDVGSVPDGGTTPDGGIGVDVGTNPDGGSRGRVIAQYFFMQDGNWADKLRQDTPFEKLNRLYIGFTCLKKNTQNKWELDYLDPANDDTRIRQLVEACRKKNPAAQIFIVSGYGSGCGEGSKYVEASKGAGAFAENVLAFMRKYGLDGYDMDWENEIESGPLNTLLAALRTAFDEAGKNDGKRYGLTLAVWQYPEYGNYDFPGMMPYIDQINIMSYGPDNKLDNCAKSYMEKGVPASKIVGGIETEIGYAESGGVDTLGSGGSISEKCSYAIKTGLAGMMEWRLDNDYCEPAGYPTYKGASYMYELLSAK